MKVFVPLLIVISVFFSCQNTEKSSENFKKNIEQNLTKKNEIKKSIKNNNYETKKKIITTIDYFINNYKLKSVDINSKYFSVFQSLNFK